jgi:hypothetical protein
LIGFFLAALGAAASCSQGPVPTCSSGKAPTFAAATTTSSACGTYDALVAASDYMSSSAIGTIAVNGKTSFTSGADLGSDPALESSAGRYFWIASDTGYIIEVDPHCLEAKGTYDANDCDHAGTTDPQDIAVAPDGSLWIVRFDVPSILVLNSDGSRRSTIDLSSLDPKDGNPNADAIRILDPTSATDGGASDMASAKAFVALGILDNDDVNLTSTRPSKLAEIDLVSGVVVRVLELQGRNPFGFMAQEGTALYLADAGNWESDLDTAGAGIERVDTRSFTSELLVNNRALGGHAVQVAVTQGCAVAIVAGASPCNGTSLVAFDPASGKVAAPALLGTAGYDLEGLAWLESNVLLVGYRSSSLTGSSTCPSSATAVSGGFPIHAFDRSGVCALTERAHPIVAPQAPVGILALR